MSVKVKVKVDTESTISQLEVILLQSSLGNVLGCQNLVEEKSTGRYSGWRPNRLLHILKGFFFY